MLCPRRSNAKKPNEPNSVLPKDFDEQIARRENGLDYERPELLTYYRTNSMEYSGMKDLIIQILRGAVIGVANSIPGVSGWVRRPI